MKHFWQWPCLSGAAKLAQPVTLHFSGDVVRDATDDDKTSDGKSTKKLRIKAQLTHAVRVK